MSLCEFIPYVAPEILTDQVSKYDPPNHQWGVDYWSFGIIMMEMMINDLPFWPEGVRQPEASHEQPPPPPEQNGGGQDPFESSTVSTSETSFTTTYMTEQNSREM